MNLPKQLWQYLSGQRRKDELRELRSKVYELEMKERQLQILNVNLSHEYQLKLTALEREHQAQIKRKEKAELTKEKAEMKQLEKEALAKERAEQKLKQKGRPPQERRTPAVDRTPEPQESPIDSLDLSTLSGDDIERLYQEAKQRCPKDRFQDIVAEIAVIIDEQNRKNAH
jgi:hypothetical protein